MAQAQDNTDALKVLEGLTLRTLTVISSSRIRNRVTTILDLLGYGHDKAAPRTSSGPTKEKRPEGDHSATNDESKSTKDQDQTSREDAATTTDGKPITVAISAKSPVASKLISIVEIVKREIQAQKSATTGTEEAKLPRRKNASLFQYSALRGVMVETKASSAEAGIKEADGSRKRKHVDEANDALGHGENDGQAAAKRQKTNDAERNPYGNKQSEAQQASPTDTTEAKQLVEAHTVSATALMQSAKDVQKQHDENRDDEDDDDDDDDDDDAYFEVLEEARVIAATVNSNLERKPPRATPVLTVYLSRKPVDKLRELYGYMTNPQSARRTIC